jgi:integrase
MTQRGTITERGPGRYQLRWRVDGKQLTETIHGTTVEARSRLKEIIAALDAPRSPITFNECADHFLRTAVVDLNEDTVQRYREHLNHARRTFGDKPVADITRPDVQAFHAKLITDNGLTKRTAKAIVGTLRRALDDAILNGHLGTNPALRVATGKIKRSKSKSLTTDQLVELIERTRALKDETTPVARYMHEMVLLAAYEGMRLGEVVNLTWGNLDPSVTTLTLDDAKTESGERTFALDPVTAEALRALRRDQGTIDPSARVFPGVGTDGKALSARFTRLAARWGMPDGCSFHRLRHTYATIVLSRGVPVAEVSRHLGHSSPAVTYATYAHVLPENINAASGAMSAALGG